MSAVRDRVQAFIRDDVQAKKIIEVYPVAEAIGMEFPEYRLQEIVAFVSEEVVAAGANAHWDKDVKL